MAVVDLRTLSAAKTYTDESLLGGGAIKGANAVIAQIKRGATENEVVFEWTLADGSKQTDSIIVKNGKDGEKGKDGKDGIDGIDGEKGDKGDQGDKGIGIESITKKSSAGLVDTYLIVFTDGTESSFDVVNGANITKTSQLENDSNFITNVVNNLLNYYTKNEVYTKANIDELLRNIGAGLSVKIVTVLPTEGISGTTIYLIKTTGNNYNQYMWIDNAWANLGSTTVDLSNYYTKDKVEEILLGYVTKDVLASILIDYVKKSELAKVATSNDYNDLNNLPQIPDISSYAKKTDIPTTLPADGGNSDTVNNHTVETNVPADAVFTDTVYDDTELKGSIAELSSNLGEKVDYKVVVEDGNRYVEDIVVQDINTWLPNDNSSILINLKKTNGINYLNFQLLCNKKDSKNWSCIVNGAANELWKIRYIDGVRYIDELATMDKVNALHKETTGYITGSLLGSVVKDANLYYQKFGDNRLVINGWVSVDAVSVRTPIFTLPNNWKANSNYLIPCYVIDSNVACACMIDITKGTVNSYTPLPATSELRFCGEIYLT